MKQTFKKNVIREITKSISRFLAILAIVALGVGFLAGLLATTPDMRTSADRECDNTSLMDIRIVSTHGLTEDDLNAIKSLGAVEQALGEYSADAIMSSNDNEDMATRIHSIPMDTNEEYLNKLTLVEGRMPKNPNECVIEHKNFLGVDLSIGDKLSVSKENEDIEEKLSTIEFEIVGIVKSIRYFSVEREHTTIGAGTIGLIMYTPRESFSYDVYTDIYLTVKNAKKYNSFYSEYDNLISKTIETQIDAIVPEREEFRYNEIVSEATNELNKGKREYFDEKAKADKELREALDKINTGKANIKDAQKKLDDGYAAVNNGQYTLNKEKENFNALVATGQVTQEIIDQTNAQFAATQYNLDQSYAALNTSSAELATAKADLDKGIKEYEENMKKANDEFNDAWQEILDAEKEISDIEMPEWYVFDRHDGIMSFESFASNAQKIEAIAQVFPIFFFLVAALVALTTMTRMVEEERTQIGILKALGYSKFTIASKYIIYAGLASVLGSIIGLLIGFKLFPTVIWNAYEMMYTLPPLITEFNIKYALISSLTAITCTLIATFSACYGSLKECAASLMLPKTPKPGKRILLEYITPIWKRLKFTHKVTARNLFRYKKRLFMTVVGVAGCTALLVTGFGLKDSIGDIVDKQFNEIFKYNLMIGIKDKNGNISDDFVNILNNKEYFTDYTPVHQEAAKASSQKSKNKVETMITTVKNSSDLNKIINLRDRKTKENIEFNDNTVIVTEKLAETLNIKIGDEFILENNKKDIAKLTVAGITENYVTGYVYIPHSIYEKSYGSDPIYNIIASIAPNANAEKRDGISKMLLTYKDDVSGINFTDSIKEQFANLLDKINYIVIVLIISAGILAFIVLYNLTNINITERIKELATIKVLGFYNAEVGAYIYRETFILSILGTLAGLVLGIFLHAFVVRTSEVDAVTFGRTIYPLSYIYSALITIAFSILVNIVMIRKLIKIDMVESMKAPE